MDSTILLSLKLGATTANTLIGSWLLFIAVCQISCTMECFSSAVTNGRTCCAVILTIDSSLTKVMLALPSIYI